MFCWTLANRDLRGGAAVRERGEGGMMNLLTDYGFLAWIVIGAVAGAIAKFIMPGRDPGGCLVTILLGVAGAALAGFLGNQLGWYRQGEGAGFLAAIVGAIIILFVYRLIAGRR
jgi:uncharacterized membrane protein YeaQ/YmgE (transglycosylase-associated protein family)